jgi:hypothetical protein
MRVLVVGGVGVSHARKSGIGGLCPVEVVQRAVEHSIYAALGFITDMLPVLGVGPACLIGEPVNLAKRQHDLERGTATERGIRKLAASLA